MIYMRYFSQTQKQIIDECLIANYLKYDRKEMCFPGIKEYLNKHNIPQGNMTVAPNNCMSTIVRR